MGTNVSTALKIRGHFKISETLAFFLKIMFIRHVILNFIYSVLCSYLSIVLSNKLWSTKLI